VTSIETVGFKASEPFVKVRATNTTALPDNGAGAFNLSDAGTPQGNPASYRDLSVNTQLQGSTTEVRAKLTIFKEGLEAGDEVDLTSAIHGYTAETFTIMELTTEWPSKTSAAVYHLDLGLGEYAAATTGAGNGGPLGPIRLGPYIPGPGGPVSPGGGSVGSGSSAGGTTYAVALEANTFDDTIGSHDVEFDTIYDANDPFDVIGAIPALMGLTLSGGGTAIEATEPGTWAFWVQATGTTFEGNMTFGHPQFHANPIYELPDVNVIFANEATHFTHIVSLLTGETIEMQYSNDNAGDAVLQYVAVVVTRLGSFVMP
jgi:hypothetical protein